MGNVVLCRYWSTTRRAELCESSTSGVNSRRGNNSAGRATRFQPDRVDGSGESDVVVMEARCAVETWTQFGFSGAPRAPTLTFAFGTHVCLCTGSDHVYVFNAEERKPTAVLQCPGPVSDLAESHDKRLLYVSCSSGVYGVSLQFLLSRSQSTRASSGPVELKISSEFLVVGQEGASSLLLVGSVLVILSQRDTSWLLSLYKISKQSPPCPYEMLSTFSLPQVSLVSHGDDDLKTPGRRRPVLACVYFGHVTAPSLSSTFSTEATLTNHFPLEPVLFKLLFGIDSALLKSPVILCGLPDGRLCFLPLLLPGSRLRVLHSLEQPVVLVAASVVMKTGSGLAQCLVTVGEQGRVLLIKTDEGGPEGGCSTAGFTERCLPGPVVCGSVDNHNLYYSTGSDLLVLDLSDGSHGSEGQERNEETSSGSAVALRRPTSLNVCRVISLAEPTYGNAGEVQLLALSLRGQLQRITLPTGGEKSRLPSSQVGRSVKDLLSAIGDVCERASVLRTSIKSKNRILGQLNQVLNISILLNANKKSEEHFPMEEKPIRCHAITRWSRLLQKDSLSLTCVLDNSSPYILEQGWTLSITVCPLSYPPSAGGGSSSTTFSFPFYNLHPGETLEVTLPLAAAGETSFPMKVNCSLIFSLAGLLGEEGLVSFTGLQRSCISLPLNTLTVDWLHALQVNRSSASHKNTTFQSNSIVTDTIKAFLSSQRVRSGERGRGGVEQEEEQYSASVHVSLDLLRDTHVLKSSDLDPHAPQNHCISLLDWLLSEEHGGVKLGHQGDKIALSSSVVYAQSLNGDSIKLTAKEVNVGEESLGKEESLSTIEVRAESRSIAAVCGLHHAVLHRAQTLLQKAPERSASTKRVYSLGLRPALQRAERLLQQIQQSQISEAFGVGVTTGQMTRSVLSVYQELRKNPLLII